MRSPARAWTMTGAAALAAAACVLVPGRARAAVTVDTVASVTFTTTAALSTSIALDAHNNVHVAYFDETTSKVKYTELANGQTSWSAPADVDTTGAVHSTRTAVAVLGTTPHVVYYDLTNHALKHARLSGSSWISDTVESFTSTNVFCAIAVGTDGRPRVAYSYSPSSSTKFAEFTGTSWSTYTVLNATCGAVDVVLDRNNKARVAFVADDFESALFPFPIDIAAYAEFSGSSFTALGLDIAGDTTTAPGAISVALDETTPAAYVSYFDALAHTVKIASFNPANLDPIGTVVSTATVDVSTTGLSSSIGLSPVRRPLIAYFGEGEGLKLASTADGVTWSTSTLDAGADVGAGADMAVNGRGSAFVAYADVTGDLLKFASNAARGLSLSGTVLDGAGAPLTGVTLSLGGSVDPSAVVDGGAGTFSFSNLWEGGYTVTPGRSGYGFQPANRSVSITSSAAGLDFTGGQVSFSQVDNLIDPTQGQSVTMTYAVLSGHVFIGVYTLDGRLVKALVDADKSIGTYTATWDGRNQDGDRVASGIYLVKVKAAGVKALQKVAVVK